jgi:hypothetical protein
MPDNSPWRSDEVVMVALDTVRNASWGDRLEFYARIINLTERDIKLTGMGSGASQVTDGGFMGETHPFPFDVLSAKMVSPPYLVKVFELNPASFGRQESVVALQMQQTYEGSSGESVSCEPVVWMIRMLG